LSPEIGEGVENVYLTFVDERVAQIKVTYNSARSWDGADDFFARESKALGLPWPAEGGGALRGSGGNEKYTVECGDFNAMLAYSFGVSPNITLANVVARKMVDTRQEKQDTVVRKKSLPTIGAPRPPQPDPSPPPPRRPGEP
jgi:hypothetical protein